MRDDLTDAPTAIVRTPTLREEIASAAAALIAEDGLDYASAKRKAYERITGGRGARIAKEDLPSNEQIQEALRDYQALFQQESQPQRLLALRKKALALMRLIVDFQPVVVGAIANGTAGEHSDIHIHCYTDNAKALGLFLIDHHIAHEAAFLPHVRAGRADVEALALRWQGELAVIAVYSEREARRLHRAAAKGHSERLDIRTLEDCIAESNG